MFRLHQANPVYRKINFLFRNYYRSVMRNFPAESDMRFKLFVSKTRAENIINKDLTGNDGTRIYTD